jgi:hypothetical protein
MVILYLPVSYKWTDNDTIDTGSVTACGGGTKTANLVGASSFRVSRDAGFKGYLITPGGAVSAEGAGSDKLHICLTVEFEHYYTRIPSTLEYYVIKDNEVVMHQIDLTKNGDNPMTLDTLVDEGGGGDYTPSITYVPISTSATIIAGGRSIFNIKFKTKQNLYDNSYIYIIFHDSWGWAGNDTNGCHDLKGPTATAGIDFTCAKSGTHHYLLNGFTKDTGKTYMSKDKVFDLFLIQTTYATLSNSLKVEIWTVDEKWDTTWRVVDHGETNALTTDAAIKAPSTYTI